MAILTDVWSGRPSTLVQTQQSRSKVCRDGGSHCLPSTRSECRRGNGEVGYAPMQHTTHSHPNSIPILPTHSSCRPPHIISCCPLEPARCIVSHRYLGNYLISLDDDGPSFDKAINSTCNLQCRQDVAWSILRYFNTVHACALSVNWSRIPKGTSPPKSHTPTNSTT